MEKEVLKVIKSINKIWTKTKEINKLNEYFHEDMVALGGVEKNRIVGKDNCIKHWENCSKKKIYSWKEYNIEIKIYDKIATVNYTFDIELEKDNKKVKKTSEDFFVLVSEDTKWKVISAVV